MPTAASPTTRSSARSCLPDIKDLRLAGENYLYWSERPCLAVSSDDKYVYFAGLSTGAGDYKKARPLPCVFRVDVDKRGPAEVFVGKLDQPGKEKDLLTAPRGLAVAKGLLYVADPAGQSRRGLQGSRTAPTPARSPSRTRRSSAWTRPAARSTSAPTPARRPPT